MPAELSQQSRGWLRFIWDKATTPDDWSAGGTPHPWWDRDSTAPMCAFPRFDLSETSYILPIFADQTPAWREVYTRIADELVGRHTSFWAAIDWLTLIGHDPNQDQYPPEWLVFLPPHLQGRYDPPGWTANGVAPWGLQPDPIGADGNLFFRGFFNLILSIYRYVSGDDKWEQPFKVAGYRDETFEWTHARIAEFLNAQWRDRPQGPHCENTKIWPYCLAGAGLGLQLCDNTTGSNHHGVFDEWVEFAKKNYLVLDRHGGLKEFPWYYDPIEEVVVGYQTGAAPFAVITIAAYILPQNRAFGEYLYREGVRLLGWDDPAKPFLPFVPDPRFVSTTLLVARELGDTVTEARLRERLNEISEPRWFGDEEARFGYWFGPDEAYPRGQLSALTVAADAIEPGAWSAAFTNTSHKDRFLEPTVEGIDYPAMGIARAYNDAADGALHIGTFAATPSRRGASTSFRVTKLGEPSSVSVRLNDIEYPKWRVTGDDSIEIDTDIGDHSFRIVTGRQNADGAGNTTVSPVPSTRIVSRVLGAAAPSIKAPAARRQYSVAGVKGSCTCC